MLIVRSHTFEFLMSSGCVWGLNAENFVYLLCFSYPPLSFPFRITTIHPQTQWFQHALVVLTTLPPLSTIPRGVRMYRSVYSAFPLQVCTLTDP